MTRSSWRVLAFGALLASVALPASAQVVVGGSSAPNVEVNWSVLDNLGRQPNLADMLKTDPLPGETQAAQPRNRAPQGVQYRPYKPGAQPYAKGGKTAAKPAKAAQKVPAQKAKVTPASAKADHMADLVQSSRSEPKAEVPHKAAAPALPPKADVTPVVEAPKPAGPQVSLPELPKPAAAPVQQAKAPEPPPAAKVEAPKVAEAPKVEAPKVAEAPKVDVPKVEAPALPPTALTPPPLPVVKAEPKPEPAPAPVQAVVPAPAPQQIAALPPSPAPVAAGGFKGDTLTIPFAGESARVPDRSLSDLERLAKRMLKDESLGLQLLAYADGDDANASKARRLSLSRALEVRKYLMDQGLRSTRIEVRALGNKLEGAGSPDRVDAVLVSR